MIHRLAISIGTIAAAVVLAIGFAASGFGPAAAPAEAGLSSLSELAVVDGQPTITAKDTGPTPTPVTKVRTTTVYVKPAPKRKVIHVTRHDPAAAAARPKVKVVSKRPPNHADDRGEGRGEKDDD